MHTRRFGSFLIGAWLVGSILMWFVQSQSLMTPERILATPPPQLTNELENMGPDVSRQLMRHQAMQLNRRIAETWDVIQLGIGAALLVTSILTPHRSRITIASASIMIVLCATMAFYFTPLINNLGRAVDFLPPTAALRERASLSNLEMWHNVLEVFKMILALVVSVRLLFDFYEFREKMLVSVSPDGKRRRRKVRATRASSDAASDPAAPQQSASSADSAVASESNKES